MESFGVSRAEIKSSSLITVSFFLHLLVFLISHCRRSFWFFTQSRLLWCHCIACFAYPQMLLSLLLSSVSLFSPLRLFVGYKIIDLILFLFFLRRTFPAPFSSLFFCFVCVASCAFWFLLLLLYIVHPICPYLLFFYVFDFLLYVASHASSSTQASHDTRAHARAQTETYKCTYGDIQLIGLLLLTIIHTLTPLRLFLSHSLYTDKAQI